MMDKCRLSIIVPVYNAEEYLDRCLISILEQEFASYEVILVDDGSTDSSPLICDRYSSVDPRFRTVHKENGGVTSARLRGVEEAAGDWIGFVDGDDYIEADMYQRLADNAIKYNKENGIVIIDIKNAILYDSFSTEALVIAALAYIDLKNYYEAINMLNNAIMNDAENPIPLMIRAYIYNNLIDNAKLAVADYSRVARIVDEDFPNIAYKAMAQTSLGKVLDGDATIRKALDKCPENANNQYLTAVYYAQSGKSQYSKSTRSAG